MTRPLALDLYCKAGGSARGLHAAGFDVVGVDIEPQPNYPYWFIQGDVLKVMRDLLRGDAYRAQGFGRRGNIRFNHFSLNDFAFIWASPPCQGNSNLRHAHNAKEHADLIAPTRKLLKKTDLPWTIENVDSDLTRKRLRDPFMLCGTTFGLGVMANMQKGLRNRWFQLQRHRLFETNFPVPPTMCHHTKDPTLGIYGGHCRCRSKKFGGRGTVDFDGWSHNDLASDAMDIPRNSMTVEELGNAIPPAYARWIGQHALKVIREYV